MESDLNLIQQIEEKIEFGQYLIDSLTKYKNIDGIGISESLVVKNNNIKKEYLQCTNLTHFAALIDVLDSVKDCVSVNKVFSFYGKRLNVDIIADNGLTWIKVIARNPKSLNQIYMGDAGYGTKSIADQAEEFLECAELYPCLFKTPKVLFVFANGIEYNIAEDLESIGVIIKGNRLKNNKINELDTKNIHELPKTEKRNEEIDKINLDVSAMIAYVSSLTNGHCNYIFKVSALTQQAEWERKNSVKPILDKVFQNKKLFCCETAKINFDAIVNTVGGPNEKIRAQEFMKRVIVLPDDATVVDTLIETNEQRQFSPSKALPLGGKIKQRSKIIFKFGDNIQAMTVTANDGFVRSAKQKGINFVVFVHESRALTEQKEATAEYLNLS